MRIKWFIYGVIWVCWGRVQIETQDLGAFLISTVFATMLTILNYAASQE
jgi:hypothetical protein